MAQTAELTIEWLRRGIAAMEQSLLHGADVSVLDTTAEVTARTRDCTRDELVSMFEALEGRIRARAALWRRERAA